MSQNVTTISSVQAAGANAQLQFVHHANENHIVVIVTFEGGVKAAFAVAPADLLLAVQAITTEPQTH